VTLEAALAAEDWERALPAALDRWRAERSIELADLIDRIGERCPKPAPPHTRAATHRWWMANALAPDPMMVGALLDAFPIRLYVDDAAWDTVRARWATSPNPVIDGVAALPPPRYWVRWRAQQGLSTEWHRNIANWVDRVAAMVTWPDDPRVARMLATVLLDPGAMLEGDPGDGPWPAIADRVIALGDPRVGELVARVTDPHRLTSRQRAIHAVREAFPVTTPPAVGSTHPAIDPQLRALWDEVGAQLDDDAPRLVLADALLARGDNRGELIVLQCARSGDRAQRADVEAGRLLKREWERWMGPLALLLARRGTEVRRGLLERIRVGINGTPPWVWEAVAGHHELVAVREVRPAMAPPHAFAKLVAGLPRFPRLLELDAPEVLAQLDAPAPGLEHVHYAPISNLVYYGRERPPIELTYRMLAKLAPNLTRLDLGPMWWHGGQFRTLGQIEPPYFGELVALIRALFPRLAHIRIMESSVRPEARASLRELDGVELIAKFDL